MMQLLAFEDMGVRVEELMQYAAAEEDVPFAHTVTKFPVSRKPTLPPTFADKQEVRCACKSFVSISCMVPARLQLL